MATTNSCDFGTGTAGQVLTSNGAGVAPTFQTASIPLYPQLSADTSATTLYTGTLLTHTASTNNHFDKRMYLVPFIFYKDMTATSLEFNVTTAAAGSTARIGIYSSTNGLPSTLLVESGVINTATTGVKTEAISQALTGQTLYYAAITVDENGGAISTRAHIPVISLMTSTFDAFNGYYQDTVDPASSLPSTASVTSEQLGKAPAIAIGID